MPDIISSACKNPARIWESPKIQFCQKLFRTAGVMGYNQNSNQQCHCWGFKIKKASSESNFTTWFCQNWNTVGGQRHHI